MIEAVTRDLTSKLTGFENVVEQARSKSEAEGQAKQIEFDKEAQAKAEAEAKARDKELEEEIARHRQANVAKKLKEHEDMESRRR